MEISLKKAGVITCLFCLLMVSQLVSAQSFSLEGKARDAYDRILNFEFSKAETLLEGSSTSEAQYLQNLNECLELLLTEDPQLFTVYEDRFENRTSEKPQNATEHFVDAEMNLQWAFVYLKFGHELDAAAHFRKAYKTAMHVRKRWPSYLAVKKTTGVVKIMVGAVPEKYTWIMDLFGMQGSINDGLKDLEEVISSDQILARETQLIKALVEGYLLHDPLKNANALAEIYPKDSAHSIGFGAASLYVKGGASKKAKVLLSSLAEVAHATPLEHYLFGEVLLHGGSYEKAIVEYQRFLSLYKGKNNIKDAHYKIGLCYRLIGKETEAENAFTSARKEGSDLLEADRSAAFALAAADRINPHLIKARYFTDGGYYSEARLALGEVAETQLTTLREKVEYFYRKARLEHATNHIAAAELFYKQVIDMSSNQPWYYAANASLQLGFIYQERNDNATARSYFRKALSYKKHEYKNSIDSKAKTALNRMK